MRTFEGGATITCSLRGRGTLGTGRDQHPWLMQLWVLTLIEFLEHFAKWVSVCVHLNTRRDSSKVVEAARTHLFAIFL